MVLSQYEGELALGLMDVYPNIGLDKMCFNPHASMSPFHLLSVTFSFCFIILVIYLTIY